MIGAAIFVYLGLVILGALPSPIPATALAAAADFFAPHVEFWRAYDLGPRTAHFWPYLGWGMIAVGGLGLRRFLFLPFRYAYWLRWIFGYRTFGNARIARWSDLRKAGLTKPGGLLLGRSRGRAIFHNGEGHLLTIGGTGGGKSSGLVVPALCELTEGAVVVTDPSGELTAMTARRRAEIGPVVFLNPFGSVFEADTGLTYPDDGMNLLAHLDPAGPNFISEVSAFARLLMVTDRRESGSYWNDEGAEFLSLLIAATLLYEEPDCHDLTFIYRRARDSAEAMEDYLWHLAGKGRAAIADDATRFASMLKDAPQQWQGVISKVALATKRYAPGEPLGVHVAKNGFDVRRLKRERVTVFLLVPSSMLPTALPWLNLLFGIFSQAVAQPGPRAPVTLLLDETPALGYLPDLRSTMAQNRKAGLRVWIFTQTYAALAGPEMYGGEGMKELMGLCVTKQFFAIDEPEVCEMVSRMAGQRSLWNPSTSGTAGDVGQPLIRPEDVRGLRKWHQFILRGGMRNPIRGRLVPYFSKKRWRAMVDPNPYFKRR